MFNDCLKIIIPYKSFTCYIKGYAIPHQRLREELSFEIQGSEFSEARKMGFWDGREYLYDYNPAIRQEGSFPLGLLSKVVDILKEEDSPFVIIDERIDSESSIFTKFNVQLRDYQEKAVNTAIQRKSGILNIATGGGKTKTSTGIIHKLARKTVFYVHTIDLLDQAKEEFENTLGVPIGQVGGGIVDIKDITVATIQTVILAYNKEYINEDSEIDKALLKEDQTDITNYKEDIRKMVEDAEVIFFDECQHLGAESFYEIASKSYNATYRFGLSATPWRDDGKELYIEAGLGEIIYRLSATWLINNNYLIQPTIKFYSGFQKVNRFDNRPYQTIYKEDIVENEQRNNLACQIAISVAQKNRTSLIIIQRKRHGELLQQIFKDKFNIDVPFVYGGTPKKKRRELIAQFKRYYEPNLVKKKKGNGTELEQISPIMIASTIADEGLDIPHLSCVVLAGGGKSTTRILQRVGRALRLYDNKNIGFKKDSAFVADFNDNSKYLEEHTQIRRTTMQKEEGFLFK